MVIPIMSVRLNFVLGVFYSITVLHCTLATRVNALSCTKNVVKFTGKPMYLMCFD